MAYENGKVDLDRYSRRNKELEEAKALIMAEHQSAIASMGQDALILDNPDTVLAYTQELAEFLRSEEKQRCRPWLQSFIKCIWVEPGRGMVRYKIPLPGGSRFAGQTKRTFELGEKVRRSARSAPPTRGSSQSEDLVIRGVKSFPPTRGSSCSLDLVFQAADRLPRPRGDHPFVGPGLRCNTEISPQMRG